MNHKKGLTNNKLVTSSWTRINNAIDSIERHIYWSESKVVYSDGKITRIDNHTKFMLKRVLFELKNARALLVKTTFNHKDKSGRRMKNEE